jgi:hypothetical protein
MSPAAWLSFWTLGCMIIALEKDDGSLYVLPTVAKAEGWFETIDVENGEYEFCDESGQQFVAEIVAPPSAFRGGSYRLQPSGTPDRAFIRQLVARATNLAKSTPDIRSLDDLAKFYAA